MNEFDRNPVTEISPGRLPGVGISSEGPEPGSYQDGPASGNTPQSPVSQGSYRAGEQPDYTAGPTSVAASHGDRLDVHAPQHGHAHQPEQGLPPAGNGTSLKLGLAVGFLILAAVVVWGILSRKHAESALETTTVESSIPTVAVVHPSAGRLATELSLPGSTQAYIDTPIYSRTNGYLKQWFFDIGAHVKKGQLMATIETPEVDQQLQVAQADLRNAQATLNLANTTSARYQALLKSNSVSKQETDEAVANALSKQAAVEAADASVRRLQQLQSFERIYAPFDGIVTARNTDVGDLIVAGASGGGVGGSGNGNGGGHELFHLASTGRLRVFVSVPEADVPSISDGEHATLTSDEFPNRTFDGVVARNASSVDPGTRTLNVEVDVPNTQNALLPGAYVFVHFKLPGLGQYLTIPSNTLIFRAAGLQVATVRGDRVQLVPVTIAHDGGAFVEISSGLQTSDQVIVDPSDSIASGQEVHVGKTLPAPTPGGTQGSTR